MSDEWKFDKKLGYLRLTLSEEEQIKIPVKLGGRPVGTASNIKIDRTGAFVGADLDLDPEIKELIDKMQQAPHKTGSPDYSKEKIFLENDWMYNRTTETSADCVNHAEPVTLESLAETLEDLEKSRPNMTMKKSELFAHPEQAPGWLADEFEVAEFIESDNIEQDQLIIMRADLPEMLAILTPNLRGLGKCKRVKVIVPKGWFT